MTGPEAKIERAVCDYAKGKGWLAYKFTSPGKRAVPDRMFLRDGTALFVEFKAPGKKPTVLQSHEHERLRAAGFWVFVIDNADEGKALFDRTAA